MCRKEKQLDYSKFEVLIPEGKTVAWVCTECGIDPSIITNWKKGAYEPGIATLRKLCNKFGVAMEYFFKEE